MIVITIALVVEVAKLKVSVKALLSMLMDIVIKSQIALIYYSENLAQATDFNEEEMRVVP